MVHLGPWHCWALYEKQCMEWGEEKFEARYVGKTWILKKIDRFFASVISVCSARTYSPMDKPDGLVQSLILRTQSSGTTQMLRVLTICKLLNLSGLPLYFFLSPTDIGTSLPSQFHLIISSFPPLRVSLASWYQP